VPGPASNPGILDMLSSEWSACCDVHDTCYELNNSTAHSWSDVNQTPSKASNDAVATCTITTPGTPWAASMRT
jgi:hypothetical protein